MVNNTIIVRLLDGKEIELASDSPDLKSLVQVIVENRDAIDPEKIVVECDDDYFDSAGFAEIISVAVKSFLDELGIDKEKLATALSELKEETN